VIFFLPSCLKVISRYFVISFICIHIFISTVCASYEVPEITNIIFSAEISESGQPLYPADMFPSGTTSVMAWFEYESVSDSSEWGYTLYRGEDLVKIRSNPIWPYNEKGNAHLEFTIKDGFQDGTYNLKS